jgi:imidazolonepropionase-like amidohydrolase
MRNFGPTIMSLAVVAVSLCHASQACAQAAKPSYTLIRNVKIFDGVRDELTPGDVLIEDNLIKQVGAIEKVPQGTTVIDGGQRVLTPGFIDAHTHIALIAPFNELESEYSGVYVGAAGGQMVENMLMRGFTTVRDAGGASIGASGETGNGRSAIL